MSKPFNVARCSCVPILLVAAIALWLSASPASHATTATQTQSLQATVSGSVTWGSVGGGCTQTIATTDFGSVAAGATTETAAYTGCVKTSTPLSVSVLSLTPMTSGGNTIPSSALAILPKEIPVNSTKGCNSPCSLNGEETLFTAATAATNQFKYSLQLAVPGAQPAGAYTGGVLQFTATA
jgi:hypothetical protein